jgi:hypothetical protein
MRFIFYPPPLSYFWAYNLARTSSYRRTVEEAVDLERGLLDAAAHGKKYSRLIDI